MKTRTKLVLIMFCLCLIPILIINIFVTSKMTDYSEEAFHSEVENFTTAQAGKLNVYFETLLSQAKEVSTTDYVKRYTKFFNDAEEVEKYLAAEEGASELSDEILADSEMTDALLGNAIKLNSTVEKAMILNNDGVVVASTTSDDMGKPFYGEITLDEILGSPNGVSPLYMRKTQTVNIPGFYIFRKIYSEDSVCQGTYLQLCNTNFLQDIIRGSKIYNSANVSILDVDGNILEYPFLSIVNYKNVYAYEPIAQYIADAISGDVKRNQSAFETYEFNGQTLNAFNVPIENTNWGMFMIINQQDVVFKLNKDLLGIRLFSLYLSVILFGAVLFFAFTFTKPIENIVTILYKKKRGDQNARFKVSGVDEFAEIGDAFNSMFDDVFESEQRYRTIVEMTDNIVFEINFKKNKVFVSNNFNQKFSLRPKSDTLQDSFFFKGRIHKDDKDRYRQDFNRILDSANYLQGEYRFKNIYGDFAWVLIRATKFYDREDEPTKVIGVIVDIDREKKSEMHLVQRASYDALTQLYNRETFIKTLANEFELARMRKTLDAVLFIDLDDFKFFNDQYGHACGDEVLKFCADCLKEIVFDKGFAGRFGGDEFVVCLNNQQYFGDPAMVAQEIINAFSRGFVSESTDKKLSINCSIGIAFFMENGKNCEEILSAADEAMYKIKKHGKSNYGYVSGDKLSPENAEMLNNLRN